MSETVDGDRRHFLGAAITTAAAELALMRPARAQSTTNPREPQ